MITNRRSCTKRPAVAKPMKFGKILFIGLLVQLITFLSYAQSDPTPNPYTNVSITSPTAASMVKYADIPVGYHTGIPEITIPIYTVTEGPLKLPVSLDYHAGGLKVMEPSSRVGTGWTLNAGGVISRTVKGAPDDRSYYTGSLTTSNYFSDYGYENYLFIPIGGDPGNGSPPTSDNHIADDYSFIRGVKDGEPDLFFFNFNGYAGKFYFNDDRTPILIPDQDLKITPICPDNTYTNGYIHGFIITTPDGTKYQFGENPNSDGNPHAYELTAPFDMQRGLMNATHISSWYLNKITSADDQFSITLIYTAEKYAFWTISTFSYSISLPSINQDGYRLMKNYVEGVKLSQINFSNGTVKFLDDAVRQDLSDFENRATDDPVNTQAKTLGTIQVSNNSTLCKNYKLTYSYFQDNFTGLQGNFAGFNISTDRKRLKLDQVQEQTCDGTASQPPYVFMYNAPQQTPGFAPRRLSFAQDHWGFYNGKPNNSLVPTYTTNKWTYFYGADRESSWPEMSYGTLNKISYPAGGYTQFEYEANDTWLSYPKYTPVYTAQMSVGNGMGMQPVQSMTLTLSDRPYKIAVNLNTGPTTPAGATASMTDVPLVDKATPYREAIIQPGAGSRMFTLSISGTSNTTDYATATIYELVTSPFEGNVAVGGLRIKTITNNDGLSTISNVTSYAYQGAAGRSSGVLYSRPTYVQVLRNDIVRDVGFYSQSTCSTNGCLSCDAGAKTYYTSGGSIVPMETTQGNHIGYNEVKVTKTGKGSSVYRFYGSNIWDFDQSDVCVRNANTATCDANLPNYPPAPLPFDIKRGTPKYEGHFDENGTLMKETTYYPVYVDNAIKTKGYIIENFSAATIYEMGTQRKTQMTTITREYDGAGNYLTTIDSAFFDSPFHHQLTRRVTINSWGEKLEIRNRYAPDFRISYCDTISNGYQAYLSKVTSINLNYYAQRAQCTQQGCLWVLFQQYRRDLGLARAAYVTRSRANYTNPVNAFQTAHTNAKNAADGELKPVLELQDVGYLALIEASKWRNGKLTQANYFKYGYSSNPSNKVYLNRTRFVPLTDVSGTFTSAQTSSTNTSVLRDSRYADDEIYNVIGGNLVERYKVNNIREVFIWGYNRQFPVARITGTDYNTAIQYVNPSVLDTPLSDDQLRTELNNLRQQLPSKLISTYTYKPLLGMTSETDQSGNTIYYEYDALGRLKLVRDVNGKILKQIDYQYQKPITQ